MTNSFETDDESVPDVEEDYPRPRLVSQDSAATQTSFSSLINYNPNGTSSQQEEMRETTESDEYKIAPAKTVRRVFCIQSCKPMAT